MPNTHVTRCRSYIASATTTLCRPLLEINILCHSCLFVAGREHAQPSGAGVWRFDIGSVFCLTPSSCRGGRRRFGIAIFVGGVSLPDVLIIVVALELLLLWLLRVHMDMAEHAIYLEYDSFGLDTGLRHG